MRSVVTESPGGSLQAALSIEELWSGGTVYPSAAVLRIAWRGCAVTADWPLSHSSGAVCHALEILAVDESRALMRLGAAVQRVITLRRRDGGGVLSVTLRISERTVFLELAGEDLPQTLQAAPPGFSPECRMVSLPGDAPAVAYAGRGALAAAWIADGAYHLVIFERPGELAERAFKAVRRAAPLAVESGADACRLLYTALPFSEKSCALRCGPGVRATLRAAFEAICAHFVGGDDDFTVLRGEPGVFAVVARRLGSRWIVCGMTHEARTLTLRFEDLWRRMPEAERRLVWKASLLRDPVPQESGAAVEECFDALAPDVRIALEMQAGGGFVIEFEPFRDDEQGRGHG
jgi:hypothetical protein